MSRWRKVDVRLWGDERVRKLSRSAPSALVCWLYLLTARESIALPGAIVGGAASLAESLGWNRREFLRKFAEIEALGMARADWDARLVWLPNALKHNPPQSPNTVKSWAKGWEELPDCDLKNAIRAEAEEFLEGFSEGFRKAFGKGATGGLRPREEEEKKEEKMAKPSAPSSSRQPSLQQRFATWFEEQRVSVLGSSWAADNELGVARLNKELEWLASIDSGETADAAQIYIQDPKRQQQDPPCSLLFFSRDRAVYLSKAKRQGAA